MTLELIGKPIYSDDLPKRDAIHIAVIPIMAKEKLHAGEPVCADGTRKGKPIGIVDPFLTYPIYEDSAFWCFLFPNSVTSIRHEWTHPAFDKDISRSDSEQWLTDFAKEFRMGYDDFLERLDEIVVGAEESIHLSFDTPDRAYRDREIMWKHYENTRGVIVPDEKKQDYIFNCSC